ncbi:TorD/DmsD family molecular chaperone [Parasutterella excrementihominis]|jgi:TorA maturation chaperone TorD|uniref:TorD/DmsD family molecular chaperone n=1 Tax=Parasutterella excrementihominis TaxID=487175 RepID=UPI00242EAD5C|nr:molecular chaperone TorD family protein [Parasutterella excrementihominis]
MSIKQSEVELDHSSEQCSELFFKTLGLLFLNGPGEENIQLLTVGLENCWQFGLISQEEYEELSEQLDMQALGRDYASLFCLGGSSLSLYESVWLTGLAMQEPRDELRKILRACGLKPNTDSNEPEDHLGFIYYCIGMLLERRRTEDRDLKESEDLGLLREAVSHLEWTRLLADAISDRHAGNFYSNIVSIANRLAKETID